MIRATFLNLPINTISTVNLISRVVKENIKRNKNIKIEYNEFNITSFNKLFENDYKNFVLKSQDSCSNVIKFFRNFKVAEKFFLQRIAPFSSTYNQLIYETIKTEYVLITIPSVFSLPFVNFLLKKNLKILIGGNIISSYGFDKIRSLINDINPLSIKESKNLILFKGYLDVDEDLYKIIQNGKDFESTDSSFSKYSWKPYLDFYSKDISREFNAICFIYKSGCSYKKCLHCTWRYTKPIDYTADITVEEMCENAIFMCNNNSTRWILIQDGNTEYDTKLESFCKIMISKGYYIMFTISIFSFLDARNVKFYNECSSYLSIGIDSCDDYSLNKFNKIHTWNDILNASKIIKRELKSSIILKLLIVIDGPYKNKDDIIRNYQRISYIKNNILNNRIVNISTFFLMNFPDLPLIKLSNYKIIENENDHINSQVGVVGVFNKMKNYNNYNFDDFQKIIKPIIRVDENNLILKSDFEYLSFDLLKSLYE